MVLSDGDIREELESGRLVIEPLDDSAIQPASVDLRLGRELRVFQNHRLPVIDVKQEMPFLTESVVIDEVNPFILHPGEFALGVTTELIELPSDIVGRLDGKSSLGRLGLVVHSTAGFVDPGWNGNLTLELSNLANLPINLYVGMKISQISFMRLTSPAQRPYGSKGLGSRYQGQTDPTPSRFYQDFSNPTRFARPSSRGKFESAQVLRDWLNESEYQGSVQLFAEALSVSTKTAENWIYGRSQPSRKFRHAVYGLTGLPEFRVDRLDFSSPEW